MIIGKFLDPRAPSLPQQVGINTDDIAEILQENEEQSANIQQNTDDIELLKQQVSESGTRVRVDGELVAEWSPDELTDDLQQLRLAQSSDSLAIVGLQSDNITNKNNIAKSQLDISELNQTVEINSRNIVNLDLTKSQIDEIWNGSLVGGNTLNINVSGYKYLICFVSSIAIITRGITILDVNHTNEQCCVPYGNWSNDNHISIVRHAFYVSEDKQSITYNNKICYQIGNYIDNHQTNTLVKILGVK